MNLVLFYFANNVDEEKPFLFYRDVTPLTWRHELGAVRVVQRVLHQGHGRALCILCIAQRDLAIRLPAPHARLSHNLTRLIHSAPVLCAYDKCVVKCVRVSKTMSTKCPCACMSSV
jgi:hypothetical protein